jgi:hypothetical protein
VFYFARQNLFEELDMIEVVGHTPITGQFEWISGIRFAQVVPRETLELDPAYGNQLPDIFDTTIPLFSERLLQCLRDGGIHNLDAYPMLLKRRDTGDLIEGYYAVNIIGRVDAVDLDASVYRGRFGKPYFTGPVVVDAARCQGLEVFRLLHGPGFMVVNERLAGILAQGSFKALLLQPTPDYAGT